MSTERKTAFSKLVKKYLDGGATAEEIQAVEQYYQLFADEPDGTEQMKEDQVLNLESRMRENIANQLRESDVKQIPFYRNVYFRAAAVLVCMIGLIGFLYQKQVGGEKQQLAIAPTNQHVGVEEVNRYIKLPDGSTVVLHGKSSLTYGSNFNKTAREVTLTGEAFFDVVHSSSQMPGDGGELIPFIIKSGKIKTTVLGTAFNIRAWPEQKEVVVTVTRGKVRVEDENKLIAILTANEQVVYNTATSSSGEKQVKAEQTTAWVQTDMTFDEMPMGELAKLLEKRYHVKISFKNPELKHCTITGRFSGTETLEEVFRILSATSNTSFVIHGTELTIDGQACN